MKCDVAVVGCGIIGAAIAYALACAGQSVVVIERKGPGSGATQAALGVMFAVGSQQVEGTLLQLRLESWRRFEPLIEQLEADLGRGLAVNRRGILRLVQAEEIPGWTETIRARQLEGLEFVQLDADEVSKLQPGLDQTIGGGIYSPQDRQMNPQVLTQALIEAAERRGVQFRFHQSVTRWKQVGDRVNALYTPQETIAAGTIVMAAGIGSEGLLQDLGLGIPMQPVKGQALQIGSSSIRLGPVITAEDTHLVPQPDGSIWIGATVEFDSEHTLPTLAGFHQLIGAALKICPALADAEFHHAWSGLRPRPSRQRAPILGFSPLHRNVVIATGHYRNGILLAPITAAIVRDLVLEGQTRLCDLEFFAPRPSATD